MAERGFESGIIEEAHVAYVRHVRFGSAKGIALRIKKGIGFPHFL